MTKCMMIILDEDTDEIVRSNVGYCEDGRVVPPDFQQLGDFLNHFTPYAQWSWDVSSNEEDYDEDADCYYGFETVTVQINLDVKKCNSMIMSMKHKAAKKLWEEDALSKLAYRRLHDEMEEIYKNNDNNINESWKQLHKISGEPDLAREYIKSYKEINDA